MRSFITLPEDIVEDRALQHKALGTIPLYLTEYLVPFYTCPTRHYHNLQHLCWGLDLIQQLPISYGDQQLLRWAWCFHDVQMVFDPINDNEMDSANHFNQFILSTNNQQQFTHQQIRTITDLILHTKYHTTHGRLLFDLMHDIDYSIMGTSISENLLWYDDGIRKEWSHIDDASFNHHRVLFLKKLLSNYVFYSAPFLRYNIISHSNIGWLLEQHVA